MTYEEFCERLRSAEDEMDPLSEEMKEVIRWAATNHFDHLWTYLTRSTEKVEQQLKEMARCWGSVRQSLEVLE